MRGIWIRALQILGFWRKELIEILRQPRLLLTLVFGPFLILVLFGVGYNNAPSSLKTMFVGPRGSVYEDVVREYSSKLSAWVKPAGYTSDQTAAMQRLQAGDIDVVVVFPDDAVQTVLGGHQAQITVIHDKLDPIQQTAISFATKLAVDQVNSTILADVVSAGQHAVQPVAPLRQVLVTAAQQLGQAATTADDATVSRLADQLDSASAGMSAVVTAAEGLFTRFQGANDAQVAQLQQAGTALGDVRSLAAQLKSASPTDRAAAAQQLSARVQELDAKLAQAASIDPAILVQPFTGTTQVAVPQPIRYTDFYAPGAVALLVQHLGVTFGALSFVRDRALGVEEVLRVGPVTTSQTLVGKYGAYALVGAAVAAVLMVLLVFGLKVPMVGQASWMCALLGLGLAASLGIGFVASLIARTDTQAVQFAMVVLLASLFFGGFFLTLDRLTYPVKIISSVLPVTYGIRALQDVMLRGQVPTATDLIGLGAIAVCGYAASWYLLRRRLRVV